MLYSVLICAVLDAISALFSFRFLSSFDLKSTLKGPNYRLSKMMSHAREYYVYRSLLPRLFVPHSLVSRSLCHSILWRSFAISFLDSSVTSISPLHSIHSALRAVQRECLVRTVSFLNRSFLDILSALFHLPTGPSALVAFAPSPWAFGPPAIRQAPPGGVPRALPSQPPSQGFALCGWMVCRQDFVPQSFLHTIHPLYSGRYAPLSLRSCTTLAQSFRSSFLGTPFLRSCCACFCLASRSCRFVRSSQSSILSMWRSSFQSSIRVG